eukprot:648499-Alexandrium_andersonii.AAC.1
MGSCPPSPLASRLRSSGSSARPSTEALGGRCMKPPMSCGAGGSLLKQRPGPCSRPPRPGPRGSTSCASFAGGSPRTPPT